MSSLPVNDKLKVKKKLVLFQRRTVSLTIKPGQNQRHQVKGSAMDSPKWVSN